MLLANPYISSLTHMPGFFFTSLLHKKVFMVKIIICSSSIAKIKIYHSISILFCRNLGCLSILPDGPKIYYCRILDLYVLPDALLMCNRCRGNPPVSILYRSGADPGQDPTCCLVGAPSS